MGVEYYKRVWSQSKAKGSHKLTMLALAELTNEKTGRCDPSHETLAEMVCVTTRQIRKILEDLAATGEIEIITQRGRNHTNQYNILLKMGTVVPINDKENKNFGAEIGTTVPILSDENRNSSSGFDEKIGTPARENRNSSSYEPIEPIREVTERESTREPVGALSQKLVPRKPVFDNGTRQSTKAMNPLPKEKSPHVDGRKFVNGFVPPGKGATPAEIFYERNSIQDFRLTAPLEDDIARCVTDLERWRETVTAWQQAGHKPLNIKGQLDWYKNGVPYQANGRAPPGKTMTNGKLDFSMGELLK